jgi:hypothetical protein
MTVGTSLTAEMLPVLLNCGRNIHNTQTGITGTLHLSYRCHHNLPINEYLFRYL